MRRLLIFVKDPTPGRVKTRLAQAIGADAASAVYRACAELTLARLRMFQREAVVCVDPPEALEQARQWLGPAWTLHPQRGATLGERLAEATGQAFQAGAMRVVVVGTDSPWLTAGDLHRAFAALADTDVVLGPTDDGGYYLIGLSQPLAGVFDGVRWSSSEVYRRTLDNIQRLGVRMRALPMGYDLDYLEDVRRFIEEERRRGRAPSSVERIEALSQRRKTACLS